MCLHGQMVSVYAFQTEEWGVRSSAYALIVFVLFCFLFAKHLLSHKSVKSVSFQCNIELICLFALRFSVPVNFMSCGAEPPHPGYKAMLGKFICLQGHNME